MGVLSREVVKHPGKVYVTVEYDWAFALDSERILIYIFGENMIQVVHYRTWTEDDMDMFEEPGTGGVKAPSKQEIMKALFELDVDVID